MLEGAMIYGTKNIPKRKSNSFLDLCIRSIMLLNHILINVILNFFHFSLDKAAGFHIFNYLIKIK